MDLHNVYIHGMSVPRAGAGEGDRESVGARMSVLREPGPGAVPEVRLTQARSSKVTPSGGARKVPQHAMVPSVRMAQEWLLAADTVLNCPLGASSSPA